MSDDLVTIATFLNIGEAKLAQGKLSSAGIAASVRDETAMNLHIGMAMWGIKLQVPDHQVVRALGCSTTSVLSRWKKSLIPRSYTAARNASRWKSDRSREPILTRSRCGLRPSPSPKRLPRVSAGAVWRAGISGKRLKGKRLRAGGRDFYGW